METPEDFAFRLRVQATALETAARITRDVTISRQLRAKARVILVNADLVEQGVPINRLQMLNPHIPADHFDLAVARKFTVFLSRYLKGELSGDAAKASIFLYCTRTLTAAEIHDLNEDIAECLRDLIAGTETLEDIANELSNLVGNSRR